MRCTRELAWDARWISNDRLQTSWLQLKLVTRFPRIGEVSPRWLRSPGKGCTEIG